MASHARPLNSWDIAKCIGLLLMFIDHTGAYFLPHDQWLRAIGRGSAPIFLFLAGYASSYRFSKQLLVLGVVLLLSNILMQEYSNPLNILFTILMFRVVFSWLEKRGKRIERPFEWYVPCVLFMFFTLFLFQYGTLGFLFAIAGYMKRRPEQYAPSTQKYFLILTFVTYALTFSWLFRFTYLSSLIMLPFLYGDYYLFRHMEIRKVDSSRTPAWLMKLLKWISEYSGYVYAGHLLVFSWLSHVPV